MSEIGFVLKEDQDFERAIQKGYIVEALEGNQKKYGPGKITSYGFLYVAIEDKYLVRSANQFVVVGFT
ncbi:hypothetical protein [Paenibacillus sp. HJGM_3]|uniref:hypothetical protein n=1 Tax=Paenibacillus sp. HJGM_3 TaxID=3379816 RepID=UPI00385A8028